MRSSKYLLIGAAFTIASGCKQGAEGSGLREQQATAQPSAPAAAPFDPLAQVDKYMAAWSRADLEGAAAMLAPNVVYFDASVGTPAEGFDKAKGVVKAFMDLAPDVKWRLDTSPGKTPIVQADSVAYRWTFCGTANLSDPDATKHKRFRFSGATIMRFKDTKIVEQSDFYDAFGFLKQLGQAKDVPEADPNAPVAELPPCT